MAKQSLVIVESPAKAKTIGKYLGKDYEVKACMGHLRDLQKSQFTSRYAPKSMLPSVALIRQQP